VFASTNNGDADFIGVGELELLSTSFGTNVATGGTPSASSTFAGFPASEAFDTDYQTIDQRWASASTGGTNEWIMYDFGAGNETLIEQVNVFASVSEFDQTVKDILVQYSSDSSSWTTAWADTITITAGLQFRKTQWPGSVAGYTASPYGTHTYWRLLVQSANGAAISAAEVEFRATTGGADQATGGTPSVSALLIGSAADIFDNNNSTFWAINGTGWIKYQFAAPVAVGQVTWRIRGDGNPTHSPNTLLVQYSDDNSVWTTAWQVAGSSGWGDGENRTFTSPDYV
jgi:hypothetical protein